MVYCGKTLGAKRQSPQPGGSLTLFNERNIGFDACELAPPMNAPICSRKIPGDGLSDKNLFRL